MIQNWFVVEVTQPVSFSVVTLYHLLPTTQQSEGRKSIIDPSLPALSLLLACVSKGKRARVGCKGDSSSSNRMKLSCTKQTRCPVAQAVAWFVGGRKMLLFHPGDANHRPSQGRRTRCSLCWWVPSCHGKNLCTLWEEEAISKSFQNVLPVLCRATAISGLLGMTTNSISGHGFPARRSLGQASTTHCPNYR